MSCFHQPSTKEKCAFEFVSIHWWKMNHWVVKGLVLGVFTVTKCSNLIGNIMKGMIQVCFMNKCSWLVYE